MRKIAKSQDTREPLVAMGDDEVDTEDDSHDKPTRDWSTEQTNN